MTEYTKQQLLLDIHDLVERYLEQELCAMQAMVAATNTTTPSADIEVESDSEGDDVDMNTGDIWDLDKQEIVGRKDLKSGKKEWFTTTELPQEETEPISVQFPACVFPNQQVQ